MTTRLSVLLVVVSLSLAVVSVAARPVLGGRAGRVVGWSTSVLAFVAALAALLVSGGAS